MRQKFGRSAVVAMYLLFTPLAGCSSFQTENHDEITVLVAASSRSAVEKVVEIYNRANQTVDIRLSSAASNSLAQQILNGAPADVFLSAQPKWIDVLESTGLIESQVQFLSNRLVLVVPIANPANIHSTQDLLLPTCARIAVAGKNVPAGEYADQALDSLGLFQQLRDNSKIVRGSDVRMTLAFVERGEVDAGIVYATDARISNNVKVVWEFDKNSHSPIIYPAVLLKQKHPSEHARDFFAFLTSDAAKKIFEEYGFVTFN